jgi:hypothetical protein
MAALRRTEHFREKRIPKFVEWLEKILVRNPDGEEYLVGMAISCADGVVTLLTRAHKKFHPLDSSCGNGFAPRGHRRRSEGPVRSR